MGQDGDVSWCHETTAQMPRVWDPPSLHLCVLSIDWFWFSSFCYNKTLSMVLSEFSESSQWIIEPEQVVGTPKSVASFSEVRLTQEPWTRTAHVWSKSSLVEDWTLSLWSLAKVQVVSVRNEFYFEMYILYLKRK